MPQNVDFRALGDTLLAVCLPTYLMLAILLPTKGLKFWQDKVSLRNTQWAHSMKERIGLKFKRPSQETPKPDDKENGMDHTSEGD